MAFKISTKVNEITIPLEVNTFDEDVDAKKTENVQHIFSFPDTPVREEYQRKLMVVKGKRIKAGNAEANWWLWVNSIKRVEGYCNDDGTPFVCDKDGNWKLIFTGDILRIHAENAAQGLMQYIDTNEGEIEKKSEPSSV